MSARKCFLNGILPRGYPVKAHLTLTELLRDWYCPLRLFGKSRATLKVYRAAVSRFERFLRRPALVSDLQDRRIVSVLQAESLAGAAPATVQTTRKALVSLGNFAFRKHMLTEAPEVPQVDVDDPDPTAYSPEQIGAILSVAETLPGEYHGIRKAAFWRCLILTLWFSGLRISACLSILCADVSLDTARVMVRARAQKSKKSQSFLMPDDWTEATESIFDPNRRLLFAGKPINRLRERFKLILTEAGLPHDSRCLFQKLRRSCAQACRAAGGNATLHMGHSSAAITARHYLGVEPIDARILPTPGNGQAAADFSI
jgi:integrase